MRKPAYFQFYIFGFLIIPLQKQMKLLPLLAFSLGCCLNLSAQSRFLPVDTTAFFADLTIRKQRAIAAAPEAYAEFFTDALESRDDDLKREIREGNYLFNDSLQHYLESIFDEVASGNEIAGDWLILVRRSQRPNAFSMGDQIFVVHLGLLQQLDTKEELAFVLAHELAHDELRHQRNSMLTMAAEQPDMAKKARKLSRQGLFAANDERKERLAEDLRTTIYGRYSQDREKELEADSIALVYIRNSPYEESLAARAISHLSDKDFYDLGGLDLPTVFGTESYPFKEKWIQIPDDAMFGGSFGSDEDTVAVKSWWSQDSVATHPALDERQKAIERVVAADDGKPTIPHGWREFAIREALDYQLEKEASGPALINALLLNRDFPEDSRYEARIGRALLVTYQAIIKHDFDEAVPPITYFRGANAQAAIRMLRQMRKRELEKLTLAYLNKKALANPASMELKNLLGEANTFFDNQD
ncbi:hypothetical protein CEQ90_00540 [Lewinellaceae bacterium SD302]|nr:hypothetical protein CEQ90_00540 [Lewinellaceae bacterium SD302]